jgi:hypothetical protein
MTPDDPSEFSRKLDEMRRAYEQRFGVVAEWDLASDEKQFEDLEEALRLNRTIPDDPLPSGCIV